MNTEMRRQLVLLHEGQVLGAVSHQDVQTGATFARCVIDGAMNALIRIEGARAAAEYAFVVGWLLGASMVMHR